MKYIIFNEILWTGIAVDLTEGKRYKVYTGSWIEDDAKTLRNLSHWKGDILNDEDKDYSQTDLSSLEKRLDTLEGLVKELSSNALKSDKKLTREDLMGCKLYVALPSVEVGDKIFDTEYTGSYGKPTGGTFLNVDDDGKTVIWKSEAFAEGGRVEWEDAKHLFPYIKDTYTLELTKDELDALFKMTSIGRHTEFCKEDLGIPFVTDYGLFNKIGDLLSS